MASDSPSSKKPRAIFPDRLSEAGGRDQPTPGLEIWGGRPGKGRSFPSGAAWPVPAGSHPPPSGLRGGEGLGAAARSGGSDGPSPMERPRWPPPQIRGTGCWQPRPPAQHLSSAQGKASSWRSRGPMAGDRGLVLPRPEPPGPQPASRFPPRSAPGNFKAKKIGAKNREFLPPPFPDWHPEINDTASAAPPCPAPGPPPPPPQYNLSGQQVLVP